ncbi:hypothetical protein M406DRAFT_320853 [Cryphonectria parasitica EP155]|uniref:Uncharacterized protein n=1 Tax=Cryphonectria parasitica (strain ATCC 38755 / EP155) TaxID=660469 RepID=A0A9P4Y7W8_CRYP1|nr:uncharacterized protein M406DRAFT_320853 [Cryphonectria parasitica EP155]KAF3768373.1 hypothetical protein M406DRAFT_320853 [Cryphonectria parasitica EP155]
MKSLSNHPDRGGFEAYLAPQHRTFLTGRARSPTPYQLMLKSKPRDSEKANDAVKEFGKAVKCIRNTIQ